jgi:hypothetical protein
MAEILIKLADYTHPDTDKDRRGVHKRGDIVAIRPDGWSAGPHWAQSQMCYAKSGKFVLVKCPEITVAEVQAWTDSWKDDFAYTIISQNAAQGLYVVRVFEQNAGAAGQNNLTLAKVETFLTKWGCTSITFATNSCQFTFSLWNAVRSESFWERDVSSVVFTLISYSSATGIGRISADCNAIIEQFVITHANDPQAEEKIKGEIGRRIPERGGTLVGWTGRSLTFEIERSDILTRFRADIKEAAEQGYMRHRYQVNSVDVDAIVAAGGILTLTKAQVLSRLKDKMA